MSKVYPDTVPLHPLHTAQFVAEHVLNTLTLPGARRTGRTTALALEHIVQAMRNPGLGVELIDHYNSTVGHRVMRDAVELLLAKLDFNHFKVTRSDNRIGHWVLTFGSKS
uniref:Uncharacterized protein n=4 Tax=unclassified bacterial viruses TaxID=12333 RepID=A0AAU6W295_9VIRU